jgi:hypothetical protein
MHRRSSNLRVCVIPVHKLKKCVISVPNRCPGLTAGPNGSNPCPATTWHACVALLPSSRGTEPLLALFPSVLLSLILSPAAPLLCPAAPLLLHVQRHRRQHRQCQSSTARDPLRMRWWPAASARGGHLLLLVAVVVQGWRQSRDTTGELGPWQQ